MGSPGLSSLECLALLTAALCHDVQHPGLNNVYHVSSHSPLAVLYNDDAVLENFHVSYSHPEACRMTNVHVTVRGGICDLSPTFL